MTNTTASVKGTRPRMEREEERPAHTIVTTENTYDSMPYVDEEPEVAHVVAATGWVATFESGEERPLAFWAVLDDGSAQGVVVSEDGSVDVESNVEDEPGFTGYTYKGR